MTVSDSATLRAYASILEKPKREFDPVLKRVVSRPAGEIMVAAAAALRFQAAEANNVKKLQRRIHNQRVALRQNWYFIERRAQYHRCWYPSEMLIRLLKKSARREAAIGDGESQQATS